jgi:DNA repair exonuclease SbcCD nuclease subunit
MSVNLLAIGDIHLGRRPTRVPDEVTERIGLRELTPAAAWRRAVDKALSLKVDAVLLAGDVVEQNNDFYEAYGDLAEGVKRLADAGVPVLGVAGNHDVEVLPRLADEIPKFQLLGRNGVWEETVVNGRDGSAVRILGWSFPTQRVQTSPLADLPARTDDLLRLGLLHCDRDQTGSPYAPVRSAELEAASVDAWLLGHIHRPDSLQGVRPSGYLGSLTGLDPTESSTHGPWHVEVSQAGGVIAEQLPLAPLRWEALEVSVDELAAPEEIDGRVLNALKQLHGELMQIQAEPLGVGCRVRLVGRTRFRSALEQHFARQDIQSLVVSEEDVHYFIDRIRIEALPDVDLDELAKGSDPAGLLAQKILLIRGPENEKRRDLLDEAARRLRATVEQPSYSALSEKRLDESQVAALLEQAAVRALDQLLAQREAAA